MSRESRAAVRNVWLLASQRGSQLLVGLLFALFVPRMMGPETFGRYGLVTSVAMWFVLFSGMGAAQTMSRFVPTFAERGDREGLRAFVGNLLALRLAGGVAAAGLYLTSTALWFDDIDRVVLALVAASILASAVAKPLFALFLGLNLAATWGMGETLRQWLSLLLLLGGFRLDGLRGACLGLLLADVAVLAVGWSRAAPYLAGGGWRFDRSELIPYLRFGTLYFLTSILLVTSQRSGELLVRALSNDYAEVGVFAAANRIYLTAWQAMWQVGMAFSPLFVMLRGQGKTAELQRWVQRLLKALTIAAVTAVYAVLLVGDDLLPRLYGAPYRRTSGVLLVLMLALVVLGVGTIVRVLALVYDRPATALAAAAIQCVVFWAGGAAAVSLSGAVAAAAALLAAVTASTAFLSWRMRGLVPLPLRDWGLTLALGALFLPLAWARTPGAPAWNLALFGLFAGGFSTLLLSLRLVTATELRSLWRATRRQPLAEPKVELSP